MIRPSLALPRGALRPEERKRPVRAKWILDRRLGWKKKVAAACRRVDQGGSTKEPDDRTFQVSLSSRDPVEVRVLSTRRTIEAV